MKKLGIVITDGVGFRNFIMSEFLSEAALQFESITIYSVLPISAFPAFLQTKITVRELDVFVEGKATWFFRKWKEVAHLQQHPSFYGMKANRIKVHLSSFVFESIYKLDCDEVFINKKYFSAGISMRILFWKIKSKWNRVNKKLGFKK